MNEQVLVSIICDVYNHELYLRQCLEGFVTQKTNFNFEVLIHDDASTDKSVDIIREYKRMYPNLIKPIYQTENQYSKGIVIWKTYQFPRVKGKYIALCEGDDYWIDSLKLQKQVDFLEKHEDYGLVHCCAKVYNEKNKCFNPRLMGTGFDNIDEIIVGNRIVTLTVCCRTDLCKAYFKDIAINPAWKIGDYPMWIYFSLYSQIHFLNEVTGVYRVLENSASHSKEIYNEISFRLNACEISLFFAQKVKKQYLSSAIKKRTLNIIFCLYIEKKIRIDLFFLRIVKDLKVFSLKIFVGVLMAEFEWGRRFLRDKYLQ